jgi:hypothetical protein
MGVSVPSLPKFQTVLQMQEGGLGLAGPVRRH